MGIKTIGDLYIGGTFASFVQLQGKYKLPRSNFFRFLQIRNYIRNISPTFERAAPSALDKFLLNNMAPNVRVSHLYDSLQAVNKPSTSAIKLAWENELGTSISDELWEDSLEEVNTCSINSRHCLIQFRVIHRCKSSS